MKRMTRFFMAVLTVCYMTQMGWAVSARVAGKVLNGTNQNKPIAGVRVDLVRPGISQTASKVLKSVTTDAAGRFDMGALDLPADEILTTRIERQGFTYEIPAYDGSGQLKKFGLENLNSAALEMTIFDGTTEAPPLTFQVHHVALQTEERDLKCIERIVVQNPSLRTFVGGPDGATIRLNLPLGAQNVELDDAAAPGGKLVKRADGWWVAKPITPDVYQSRNAIIVQYKMPWNRRGIDLSRKLAYPVQFFFIAREEKDRKLIVSAPELTTDKDTPVPIDGQPQMRIVNSKGPSQDGKPVFAKDTLVTMNVSRPLNPLVWAFVAFVAALCLAVPLTLMRTRRGGNSSAGSNVKIAEPQGVASVNRHHYRTVELGQAALLPDRVRSIIEEIAALDDSFEAGDISRNEYMNQRSARKAEALAAMEVDVSAPDASALGK
jgi:hypothetical protein